MPKTPQDFWGDDLAVGDFVVYCCTKVPRMGQIVAIRSQRVQIKEVGGRKRDLHFQSATDLRTPHNVIRAEGPRVTAYLLKRKHTA